MNEYSLSDGHTLELFDDSGMVFSSSDHWIIPLFKMIEFLKTYEGLGDYFLIDKISGAAAAVITVYAGIKRSHSCLISEKAIEIYEKYNVEYSYDIKTERIMCSTESIVSVDKSIDENMVLLSDKAGLKWQPDCLRHLS